MKDSGPGWGMLFIVAVICHGCGDSDGRQAVRRDAERAGAIRKNADGEWEWQTAKGTAKAKTRIE